MTQETTAMPSTHPAPAGRNAHREFITTENAALIFIDHQAAIMSGVGDIDPVRFRNNVVALARIAKLHDLPTILSDNMPDGFAGPLMPELTEILPGAPLIHRDGPINAWDDPAFVAAVEATGRRKLVIAGCTTDICLMFPALSALAAGYDVYGVIDASGTWSVLDQQIAVHRLVHAGVVVINTANVLTELQYNHRKPTDSGSGELFAGLVPQLAYTSVLLRQGAAA
jgi:nicotinamidase-related amidase